MLNVYVDIGVKDSELFKQVLNSSNLEINVLLNLSDVAPNQVDVAVIWMTVPSCLKELINLKLLLTSGSGIDHIIDSSLLPHSVPIIRLVDEKLRNKVADYVVDAVYHYMLLIDEPKNSDITIGIMGLGLMGDKSAKKLNQLGYEVIGWVKSNNKKRSIQKVYSGDDGLNKFASLCQIIVCQLPLTEKTQHVLNKSLFDSMPKDGYIINVGRGGHLNEDDLLSTINEKHLKGACLDVFKIEPLPEDDKLQNQPEIKLTPHIAGGIFPEDQAKYASEVIQNFFEGDEQLEGLFDFDKKY
jgi:glyoxylate/hydroxypyruvate reductase A